jgi:hypothetical protein
MIKIGESLPCSTPSSIPHPQSEEEEEDHVEPALPMQKASYPAMPDMSKGAPLLPDIRNKINRESGRYDINSFSSSSCFILHLSWAFVSLLAFGEQ